MTPCQKEPAAARSHRREDTTASGMCGSAVGDRRDARQRLTFEKLEHGTTPRRDVAHAFLKARLHDGSYGVASAHNRQRAVLLGGIRMGTRHGKRALVVVAHLKDAHGSVPDDRLRIEQHLLVGLERLRADVEPHPSVWDFAFYEFVLGVVV